MSENKTFTVTFPSTTSLLGLLFVGLKLTGYINWSWTWVLAPFWIPVCVFLLFLIIVIVIQVALEKPYKRR